MAAQKIVGGSITLPTGVNVTVTGGEIDERAPVREKSNPSSVDSSGNAVREFSKGTSEYRFSLNGFATGDVWGAATASGTLQIGEGQSRTGSLVLANVRQSGRWAGELGLEVGVSLRGVMSGEIT